MCLPGLINLQTSSNMPVVFSYRIEGVAGVVGVEETAESWFFEGRAFDYFSAFRASP